MKRPLAIAVVAGFLFTATPIAWLVAIALLYPTQFTDWMFTLNPPARAGFEALGWIASLLLFALGCGTLGAAIGLRRGRLWAWWFAVILFIVNIGGDAVALFVLHDFLRSGSGILVGLIFLMTLFKPDVRKFTAGLG
jgi:hypothetical protein